MKISSCSLALLSFVIFSIKSHNAFPYSNLSQIQTSSTILSGILTYLYGPFSDKPTTSTPQSKTLNYDPFTDEHTISTPQSKTLNYDPFTDEPTNSTPQSKTLNYDPFTDEPTNSTPQSKTLNYDPFTDESTISTLHKEPLTYDPYTDKPPTSSSRKESPTYDPYTEKSTSPSPPKNPFTYNSFTDKSTTSSIHIETLIYNPFAEKLTTSTHIKEILKYVYDPFSESATSSATANQRYRNRYNFGHRYRNPIITVSSPPLTTFYRISRKKTQSTNTVPAFKYNEMYKALKEYAFIKTPLRSTPMVYLNVTVPKILLEGKVSRIASPYIIRITLSRKLAPRSNTTLPNRGFLRIVGSGVNMYKEGNMGMIMGKIASEIGKAYNMSGKDVEGMGRVIVVGPGGRMMNRRATPPKKTTVLTSPPMMTARIRLRLNCTLPQITDQVIYFEDYTKYFELY